MTPRNPRGWATTPSKKKSLAPTIPMNFLLGCGHKDLEDFELARLADVSNLRKDLHEVMDRVIDAMSQAALVAWFKVQDRQSLKHAIENEETPVEFAQRVIRERGRTAEELVPRSALEPGVAHRAAALRYQKRNIAEGKCSECPEPLDRNSVRFCAEHLRKARDRARTKAGPRSEPGSAEYLYSGDVTPSTHGRQQGTLTSLAVSREKQTRGVLAEMGIPPDSARTAMHATQTVIMNLLPTSEAAGIKEDDLSAMIGDPPSRKTKRDALMALLNAGWIQRIGGGVSGDPFRYFTAAKRRRRGKPLL
jgi:hypothetical protein